MRLDEAGGGAVPGGPLEVTFGEEVPEGFRRSVLDGLADAPKLLAAALGVAAARRPYHRVEVALRTGADTHGEALPVGAGAIRLLIGEAAAPEDARNIARHEALHLLLASALRAGERWNDPEIAFADWIVRGIESGLSAPRFRAPLPGLVTQLPKSRGEVEQRIAAGSQQDLGDALAQALEQKPPRQALWLAEAALGVHHLEAAARLGEGPLRAVLLDDWLLDYEQYAHALGNAPADAGNLWRMSDPGWSRDPLVRLSTAAQALQCDDVRWFEGGALRREDEPWVWKNRGRVRLPLVAAPPGARPAPIHGFRAALGGLDGAAVEDAARGEAKGFEARALWPRILARLLASGARVPGVDPESVAAVQIADMDGADDALRLWTAAADSLRAALGDAAPWVPAVLAPSQETASAILLVHGAPPSESSIVASRKLAATRAVRGCVFRQDLGKGRAWERLPDLPFALDPRFRDDTWDQGPRATSLSALPEVADAATAEGRLATPLAHLLSMMAFGVEECLYAAAAQR